MFESDWLKSNENVAARSHVGGARAAEGQVYVQHLTNINVKFCEFLESNHPFLTTLSLNCLKSRVVYPVLPCVILHTGLSY